MDNNYCNALPDYLLAHIFSLLTELRDKKNVRLVCEDWCEIFRDFFDTSVKLKGRVSSVNDLNDLKKCSLPITAIQIQCEGLQSPLLLSTIGTGMNRIPDGVEEIVFKLEEELESIWEDRHPLQGQEEYGGNMEGILNELVNLRKLEFILSLSTPIQFTPENLQLDTLTELTVEVTFICQLSLFRDLHKVSMRGLKNLKLGFLSQEMYYSDPNIVGFILHGHTVVKELGDEVCQPYFDLFALISKHCGTLQSVKVTYPQILEFNENIRMKIENDKICRDILQHPPKLKELGLNFLGDENGRENECDLAYPLLRAQDNLTSLNYLTASYPILGWIGYPQFLNSVQVNSKTLQNIVITNRKPLTWSQWIIPLFEGTTAIASCTQLLSLELNFFKIPPEILHFIPPTLQKLSLIGDIDPGVILPKIIDSLPNLCDLIFIPLLPTVESFDQYENIQLLSLSTEIRDCLLELFQMVKLRRVTISRDYAALINKFDLNCQQLTDHVYHVSNIELVTTQIVLNK